MKTRAAVVLLAVTLAALVAPPATAQQIWTEQQITNTSWLEFMPQVYTNQVYYGDGRNGYGEIYVWDQTQGSRRLLGGDGINRSVWAASGEKLVTTRRVNNQYDLYTWDPVNGEVAVCTAPGDQKNGRVFGNLVVWEDYRAGSQNPRVYIWDPINGERRISASETPQKSPKVWGDRVIWQQGQDVYTWTAEAGVTLIGSGLYSAIYQDRVVTWTNAWWEYPPGGNPGVFHPGTSTNGRQRPDST